MLAGLMLTAFLMGVGGMPHCATMCGAPCAMAFPRGMPLLSLFGRCLAYALLGAVAALGTGAVAGLARDIAFLRPFWVLVLIATLLLGLYLLARGRMPRRLDDWGTQAYRQARFHWHRSGRKVPTSLRPLFPLIAGMGWGMMPCGLLYAALMTAGLAPSAWGGALVMSAFAVPGALGVWAAPVLIRAVRRLVPPRHAPFGSEGPVVHALPVFWIHADDGARYPASDVLMPDPDQHDRSQTALLSDPRWAVRLSGAMLAASCGWALGHQLWAQYQAWCA